MLETPLVYRRRDSPIHNVHALVGLFYCASLALLALSVDHPLVLGTLLAVVLAAGLFSGVFRNLMPALLMSLPFAVLIAGINILVTRQGLTVIAQLGSLPPLGQVDVTLEAVVYSLVLVLRFLVVSACFCLYSLVVDPDEMLRSIRRVAPRSALAATLATRLVPVLARDGRRLYDAQRCLPGRRASRFSVVVAVVSGSLDRALDVAATLEVRGYGSPGIRTTFHGKRFTGKDIPFVVSALTMITLLAITAGFDLAHFAAYPRIDAASGDGLLLLSAGLVLMALIPFAVARTRRLP